MDRSYTIQLSTYGKMDTKDFPEITNIIESTLYTLMKIRRSILKGQMWISA